MKWAKTISSSMVLMLTSVVDIDSIVTPYTGPSHLCVGRLQEALKATPDVTAVLDRPNTLLVELPGPARPPLVASLTRSHRQLLTTRGSFRLDLV